MRRIAAALFVVSIYACSVTVLDVGANDSVVTPTRDAAVDVLEASSDAALTLEQRLAAACREPPGSYDPYPSARDLTARLVGTWFVCDPPDAAGGAGADISPIQDSAGVVVRFDGDGGWTLLDWTDAHDGFFFAGRPDNRGTVRYHVNVDRDAGVGIDGGPDADAAIPSDISRDDPTPRNGIVVYLDRENGPDPQIFVFTKNPRQMTAAEQGSDRSASYVPVE
jgi:hypothetical protein